jgi:hypothetical protein
MKTKSMIAAGALVASGVVGSALAQTPATTSSTTAAQRLQNLKARQDAAVAAAKARQNTIQQPAPTATTTTTATPTATPTTTPPTAPTTTPTAATTGSTAKPPGSASAAPASSTAPAASTSAAPKPPPVLGLDLEELKKTRAERRKSEVQQLQARWGELLRNDRAAAELKQHAQRTAYLQRIRALASKANDTKTVQAVDILITKEDTRNADAMNALRSGALPVAAGAGK